MHIQFTSSVQGVIRICCLVKWEKSDLFLLTIELVCDSVGTIFVVAVEKRCKIILGDLRYWFNLWNTVNKPLNALCLLKGHTYLNEPAAFICRFF